MKLNIGQGTITSRSNNNWFFQFTMTKRSAIFFILMDENILSAEPENTSGF